MYVIVPSAAGVSAINVYNTILYIYIYIYT